MPHPSTDVATHVYAHVQYDLNAPSHSRTAYRIALAETDEPATGKLAGRNVVENNREFRSGVFASLREAVEAVYAYTGVPFAVQQNVISRELIVVGPDVPGTDVYRPVALARRDRPIWIAIA